MAILDEDFEDFKKDILSIENIKYIDCVNNLFSVSKTIEQSGDFT